MSNTQKKGSSTQITELLEKAILNRDEQMVAQIIEKYKTFDLPARALGLACRIGCLNIVQYLVKNKFNFSYKTTDRSLNTKYALCYKPSSYKYYADFSLLMMVNDIWDRYLFGYMENSFPPETLKTGYAPYTKNQKIISPIPSCLTMASGKERAQIVNFLYKQRKISDVKCKLLLYYAILEDDNEMIDLLSSLGAVVDVPWLDAKKYDISYVPEYTRFIAAVTQKNTDVQKRILTNINKFMKKAGCQLNLREHLITALDCCHNADLAKLVLENADLANVNKSKIIKSLVEEKASPETMSLFLNADFAAPKLLNELIESARAAQLTELQTVIMNYKKEVVPKEKMEKSESELLTIPSDTALQKKIFSTEKLSDGTLCITNYKGDDVSVVIPARIGKAIVSAIGKDAFSPNKDGRSFKADQNCRRITDIIIPDTVTTIGTGAFSSCTGLSSVTFSGHGVKIGASAFAYCQGLTSFDIPEGTTTIGRSTFSYCKNLKTVKIPEGVTKIDEFAFAGCISLMNIEIPNSVRSIRNRAFGGCENLRTISLPDKIKHIKSNAFDGCDSLAVENGLLIIHGKLLKYCGTEECLLIPKGVTIIEENAFKESKNLKKVVIPETVTTIEEAAFKCSALEEVVIPASVTKIGPYNFCTVISDGISYSISHDTTIHAPAGSYAETYAKENNIPFVAE